VGDGKWGMESGEMGNGKPRWGGMSVARGEAPGSRNKQNLGLAP
jgi:hypothetical protein